MVQRILVTLMLSLMVGVPGTTAFANMGRIASITLSPQLPVMRADTPVPQEPAQLLYIQRTLNRNTVIYAARFDAQGNLDARSPIDVYWRRYEEQGQIQPLTLEQRLLAYGVRVRPLPAPGEFDVRFRAMAEARITLRQTGRFQAELIGTVGNDSMRLIYAHINATDGLFPRVIEVHLTGRHPDGRYATVVIRPN
mgnify:CR=1 FL=1